MIRYILIGILIIGCGVTERPKEREGITRKIPPVTDETLLKIIAEFEMRFDRKITFSIEFAELKEKWAGVCFSDGDSFKEVYISDSWWAKSGYYGKEELVFHELGHCELGLDHVTDKVEGYPVSIMYPVVFGDWAFYLERREEYIADLISRGKASEHNFKKRERTNWTGRRVVNSWYLAE